MLININEQAAEKLAAYIAEAQGEISGIAQSVVRDNATVEVVDAWIWRQDCTGSSTEVVDHDAMFDAVAEIVAQGVPMEMLNVWWHSHAHMGAFFSGQDVRTVQNWVTNEHIIAIVGNKSGEWAGRMELHKPFRVFVDDVYVQCPHVAISDAMRAAVKAEIVEKVKFTLPVYRYGHKKHNGVRHDRQVVGFEPRKYNDDDLLIDVPRIESRRDDRGQLFFEADAWECGCDACMAYLDGLALFDLKTHTLDRASGLFSRDKHYV